VIIHIFKLCPTDHIVITFAMIPQRIVASPPGQIVFPSICLDVKAVCCAVALQKPNLMTVVRINKHRPSVLDQHAVRCQYIIIPRRFLTCFGVPSIPKKAIVSSVRADHVTKRHTT